MAKKFSVPSAPSVYTTCYKNFRGVDYRPEEVSVDRDRFADCRNIVFDKSGFPEKRLGWREMDIKSFNTSSYFNKAGKIFASVVAEIEGEKITILHIDECLYAYKGESLDIYYDKIRFEGNNNPLGINDDNAYMSEKKSTMFSMNDSVYAINEAGLIQVRKNEAGELKAYNVLDNAEVPIIYEKRNVCFYYARDAYSFYIHNLSYNEEGVTVDRPKIITSERKARMSIVSLVKNYDSENNAYENCTSFGMCLDIGENVAEILEVKLRTGEETWTTLEKNTEYNFFTFTPYVKEHMSEKDRNKVGHLINKKLLRITENCEKVLYVAEGEDNLEVTYKVEAIDVTKITNCTKVVKYGVSGDDRVFFTGNDEYKNYIWYSEYNEPFNIPDLNYITIGSDDKRVLGFSKLSGYLAVHKEESVDDASLYLVKGELADGEALFRVTTGIPGISAVSEKGFTSIEDEPLFLTKNGVFAIQSTYIAQEKCVALRSGFINPELEKYDLSKAVMTRWKNLIIIAVNDENGTAFVLNANTKTYEEDVSSPFYKTFYYESVVWDNIFADEFFIMGDELYFYHNKKLSEKTTVFAICKFNTDIKDVTRFNDTVRTAEGNEVKPIDAWFKTKMDDDGSFMVLKTMVKRGCGIMIKPYTRSSAKVYVITDKEEKNTPIKTASAGILDFSDLDFSLISFNTREVATVIPLNTKVKKYSTLQFMIRNDEPSQGMGVLGIEKRYKTGNYKKY